MNSQLAAIIVHLGGEDFLAGLGARNFVVDDTHLSFTLVHDNSKGVRSFGHYLERAMGRLQGDLLWPDHTGHFPRARGCVVGAANVTIPENLARVVGELGIDVLRHRHF